MPYFSRFTPITAMLESVQVEASKIVGVQFFITKKVHKCNKYSISSQM